MKSQLTDHTETKKELKIEIDPATLKDAYGRVSAKYARGASVPGFRKGNAPLDVVRLRFRDEIKNEVLQQVVPEAISEAIEEHDLHPLTEPQLHLEDHENIKVNGSQPVSLHVHIEVMPEIPNPKYDVLEATRRVRPVDESEIDKVIDQRIEREAALIPVEGRPSQVGDTVIVDLVGKFDDDPNGMPITADDLEVVLGDGNIEKDFTENLVGVSEDEEKDFTVTYAEDFSSEALAGKTVHYHAKVKSVGVLEKPEANDEWVQSLDEEGLNSLSDLRNQVRSDLETYAKSEADARVRNVLVEKMIKENAFEVPDALINNQTRNLVNDFAQDMQQRGVDLNKVDDSFAQMVFSNMRTQAERDVRGALLLEKVAELEGVSVSDEEVDDEIENLARYHHTSADEVRGMLEKQRGLDNLRNNLRTRKAIEALAAKAKIVDGEWEEPEQPNSEDVEKEEVKEEVKEESKPKKKASAKKEAKNA